MKSAVLVIDVQRAMVDAVPYRWDEMLSVVANLLVEAREKGVEVIYVRHNGKPGTFLEPGAAAWEIAEEVGPQLEEVIVAKEFNDAFLKTELDELLKKRGIEKLILVGLQTEYCIDTSIRSAFAHDYKVVIPEGGNSTFDSSLLSAEQIVKHHNENIFHGRFAEVKPLEKVLAEDL